MGLVCGIPKEDNNHFNHLSSQTVVAMDLYSPSAEERDTICCFFVFQAIGDVLSITKYPVKDRRVIGQLAQSESQ